MKRLILVAGLLAALGLAGPASPFGTVYLLGQNGEHERITRAGLAGYGFGLATMDQIAGRRGSFGAVGAPDNPVRGLMSRKAAHCDGADTLPIAGYPQSAAQARTVLESCRAFIGENLTAAVTAAGRLVNSAGVIDESQIPTRLSCQFNGRPGRAKCDVLEALGLAFHASQDFYSHSNWVDVAATGEAGPLNPPGLGQRGRAPWLDPRRTAPFPGGLITGCYDGFPESRYCTWAGGVRVRHAVLNKDDGPIDITDLGSPHIGVGTTARGRVNDNFRYAAEAAIDDTHDKWAWFEDQVRARYGAARGRRILCVILNDEPAVCR